MNEMPLGADVAWEPSSKTVLISTADSSVAIEPETEPDSQSETCTTQKEYKEDINFTYTSYQCNDSQQYTEIGNHLINIISTDGFAFLAEPSLEAEDEELDFDFEFTAEEERLASYTVNQNLLTDPTTEDVLSELLELQNNTELHNDHWHTFRRLIPKISGKRSQSSPYSPLMVR